MSMGRRSAPGTESFAEEGADSPTLGAEEVWTAGGERQDCSSLERVMIDGVNEAVQGAGVVCNAQAKNSDGLQVIAKQSGDAGKKGGARNAARGEPRPT